MGATGAIARTGAAVGAVITGCTVDAAGATGTVGAVGAVSTGCTVDTIGAIGATGCLANISISRSIWL